VPLSAERIQLLITIAYLPAAGELVTRLVAVWRPHRPTASAQTLLIFGTYWALHSSNCNAVCPTPSRRSVLESLSLTLDCAEPLLRVRPMDHFPVDRVHARGELPAFAPAPLTSCVAQLSAKILRKLVERNAAQQKWT
jgi:hypothetical protein